MDDWKVSLTQEALEDPQEAIQCLIEATNQISAASQQDFQAMKDTKWYKRLWNIITFSKENEKKLAHGVSNLAKLQEIVMKALLLLSAQSAEIAEITKQNSEVLEALCQKVEVSKKAQVAIIREVERIKSGIEIALSLDDLTDNARILIVNAIVTLAEELPGNSELGQQYLSALFRTAHCTAADLQDEIHFEYIEELRAKEAQLLYQLAMEYVYIVTDEFVCDSKVLDYVNVNKRKSVAIQEQIERMVSLVGKEALLNRFEEDDYSFINAADIDWMQFDNEDEDEVETESKENTGSSTEIEYLKLTEMVQIESGKTVSYKFKEIHMGSLINCCGRLELDHCVVVYNESEFSDEISLGKNAGIHATNCTFVCKGIDTNPFITLDDNSTATFEQCVFVDCSYFLSTDKDGASLSIINCELYNCAAFAKHGYYAGPFKLFQAKISIDEKWTYNEKYGSAKLFEIDAKDVIIESVMVSCANVKIPCLFNASYGKVMNSTFAGINSQDFSLYSILTVPSVENCVFENCCGGLMKLISTDSVCTGNSHIKSCVFDKCSSIIHADRNTLITQCKFINCSDALIHSATAEPSIEISYCEFINYKDVSADRMQGKETSDPSSAIRLYADKNATNSVIKKCVFDGIDINEGVLISPSIAGKLSGKTIKVIDCDFRNCATKRKSGAVIKTYGYYSNMLGNIKSELAVTVENCRGLDKIQQNGNGVCSDKTVLEKAEAAKANTGVKAAALAVGIGLIGGPVTGLLSSSLYASLEKKKRKEQELSEKAKAE